MRKIPEAQKRGVLIIGMTNRLDLIDPAILRRGRFDHLIKVEMATTEEVLAVLIELFEGKPLSSDVDLKALAVKLAGRPLSDVSHLVREAARLAAKGDKMEINAESTSAALSVLLASRYAEKAAKIGF